MLSANQVASVLIARSGQPWLDSWSLQKLLYYAQAWHLAVSDRALFEDTIEAWKDGPVVREVWRARRDPSTRRAVDQHVDALVLDDDTVTFIDMVVATYGSMSGPELRVLTHVEDPWREARGSLPAEAHSDEPITHECMAHFYRHGRRLGGRTAADLAAVGIFLRAGDKNDPVDVKTILASQDADVKSAGDDRWGGANWTDPAYDTAGLVAEFTRAGLQESVDE